MCDTGDIENNGDGDNNKEENDICPKKEIICLSLLYLVLFG